MITLVLVYTALLDIKYREVDPRIWYIAIPLVIILSIDDYKYIINAWQTDFQPHILGLASTMIVLLGLLILYYADMIGGADVFLLLMLILGYPASTTYYCKHVFICIIGSANTPVSNYMPFALIIVLNTIIVALSLILAIGIVNVLVFRRHLERVPGIRRKLIYAISALPLRVGRIVTAKYWFPLEGCVSKDCSKRDYKDIYKISDEEEFVKEKEILKKMLVEGVLSPDTRIWATYGLPFIALVLAGFLLSMALSDILFTAMTNQLFG